MAIQKFPRPVNPKIKKQTDDQLAKVGQINQLVNDINKLNVVGPSPVGYGFEWFPEAGLTTGGVKFQYTDGVELLSYHIRGIANIDSYGLNFSQYLCSVNFPDGNPFIFPGSIEGQFQIQLDNNIINTPLADGAQLLVNGSGTTTLGSFVLYLYPYENPQPNGSYSYALVASGSTTVSEESDITALMSYDFEFLLPNFTTPPTIFQD